MSDHAPVNKTFLTVYVNRATSTVTLSEIIQHVKKMDLVYFKMVNLTNGEIPLFLNLQIKARNRPEHVTSKEALGTSGIATPSPQVFPLYYHPVAFNEIVPVAPLQEVRHFSIHGKQRDLEYCLEDLYRLQAFDLELTDGTGAPYNFSSDTVAMFVFKVKYGGNQILTPEAQVQLYNRYQV